MSNQILERWANVLSARRGVAIYSPSGEGLRTWADLEAESLEFEDRISGGGVALQTGNHPAFPALLLACLRAGKTASLFDEGFSGEAKAHIENQLGVTLRAVVSDGKVCFEETGGQAGEAPGAGDGICLYKITSGTTSLPQAIGFTAEQLVADCDQVCGTMGIGVDDLNYGVIALTHSYGFSNLVTPLLCRGVRLVVASDPLPRAIESGLRLTGATVLAAVPAMFRGLLSADSLPDTLRLCLSAGSLLDPALAIGFFEKFGRKIHAFYGTSECGGICYDASEEIIGSPGFVGVPLHGVDVGISDAPEGAKILVRSRAIGIGMTDADGRFQPADLLVREPSGFRIVGRESDLINVAGRKVNPMEIERVLAQFPGVSEAVACGIENPSRGQEICAMIAAKTPPDPQSLRRHCAARMASWKVPRRFVFAPEIPRNARGKVSRTEIARAFF
jgi:long-chain acyl-CoA synthetase